MRKLFYSASTGGFYDADIHGDAMPPDKVGISESQHAALLEAQSNGKNIKAGPGGFPVAADPEPPTAEQLNAQAEANRRAAFAAEADPLFFQWQRGEATEQEYKDKVAEIRARFPKV